MGNDIYYELEMTDIEGKYTKEELNRITYDICNMLAEMLEFTFIDKKEYDPEKIYWFSEILFDVEHWHNCMEDLRTIGEKYPDLLLTLYGDGEESQTFWVLYAYNGIVSGGYANIVYPVFEIELHQESDEGATA